MFSDPSELKSFKRGSFWLDVLGNIKLYDLYVLVVNFILYKKCFRSLYFHELFKLSFKSLEHVTFDVLQCLSLNFPGFMYVKMRKEPNLLSCNYSTVTKGLTR